MTAAKREFQAQVSEDSRYHSHSMTPVAHFSRRFIRAVKMWRASRATSHSPINIASAAALCQIVFDDLHHALAD